MRRPCLLAVLLLVPLAGCGDDDSGSDAAGKKAEYIRLGDRACREYQRRDAPLRAQLIELSRAGVPESRYLDEGARLQASRSRLSIRLANRLDELQLEDQPDAGPLSKYIAGLRQISAAQKRLSEHAAAGDRERYDTLTEELTPIALETRGIAQGYGFKVCGTSQA